MGEFPVAQTVDRRERRRAFLRTITALGLSDATALLAGSGNLPGYSLSAELSIPLGAGGWLFLPYWSENSLIFVRLNRTDQPEIVRIDEDGRTETIRFAIPNARYITLICAANARDGRIVVGGGCYDGEDRGTSFIALLSGDLQKQTLIRAPEFVSSAITVAPDGRTWAVGRIRNPDSLLTIEPDVLRIYSEEGRLVATISIVARTVGDSLRRRFDTTMSSSLRTSPDRVIWHSNDNRYAEFDVSGQEILRLDGPPSRVGGMQQPLLAVSQKNEVLVSLRTPQGNQDYWRLDRKRLVWVSVSLSPPDEKFPVQYPAGFDRRGRLVMVNLGSSIIRFYEQA